MLKSITGMSDKWRGISDDIAHKIVNVVEVTKDGIVYYDPKGYGNPDGDWADVSGSNDYYGMGEAGLKEDIDIGTCQTCGSYGKTGTSCVATMFCRELGSEFM